jgi:MFS superfamily sulfate permease-like transporter
MKKYSAENEAKYLSILVIIVGTILIVLAFLPVNLYTLISRNIVSAFLIASGISFWFRYKYWKRK